MRILSTGLGLFLFLGVLWTNCNDHDKKESRRCVQRRSAEDSLYMLNLKNSRDEYSPFFDARLPKPSLLDYDTMYWFRGQDSWGKFDDLCVLYNVGHQWYSAFACKQRNTPSDSSFLTTPVPFEKVRQIRFLLDSMGVYCYPVEVDTMGLKERGWNSDVPTYHYVVKEGESYHFFRWGPHWGPGLMDKDSIKSVLNFLAVTAAMLPDTILQNPGIFYEPLRLDNGNYTLDFSARSLSYHFIKDIEISRDNGPIHYGLYSNSDSNFQTSKKDLGKLGNIYATIELWNGQKTPRQIVKRR